MGGQEARGKSEEALDDFTFLFSLHTLVLETSN